MPVQHHTDTAPLIKDKMTTGAIGASAYELVGRTIVTSYEIPDSDRGEILLLLDNGRSFLLSCDPTRDDPDGVPLPPEESGKSWELVLYDTTGTPAGEAIKNLESGAWL
jgi:hypothetical protein